jgi:hypothetical protein
MIKILMVEMEKNHTIQMNKAIYNELFLVIKCFFYNDLQIKKT